MKRLLFAAITFFTTNSFAEENDAFSVDNDYHAYGESMIFVGKLLKTTLYPRDWDKDVCGNFDEKGEQYCIISNQCGEEVIELQVVEGIIGAKTGEVVSLKTSIGEWCEYNLELTNEKRLVFGIKREGHLGNNDSEYTIRAYDIFYDKNSKPYFFLEGPYDFYQCEKIIGTNCYQFLGQVKPNFLYQEEEEWDWIKEFKQRGILIKNEKGNLYHVQGVFLEPLKVAASKNPPVGKD